MALNWNFLGGQFWPIWRKRGLKLGGLNLVYHYLFMVRGVPLKVQKDNGLEFKNGTVKNLLHSF